MMVACAGKLRKYQRLALRIAGAQTTDDWRRLADGDVTTRIDVGGIRHICAWLRTRFSNGHQGQN
jgi:hypothetical protein